jgi:hypothetical protein
MHCRSRGHISNTSRACYSLSLASFKWWVHDEYTFDFLEFGAQHSERELERALNA